MKSNLFIRGALFSLLFGSLLGFSYYVYTQAVERHRARVTPTTVQAVQPTPIDTSPYTIDKAQLYTLINNARAEQWLAPLTINPVLEKTACDKADDMMVHQYWSHISPTGVTPWYFFQTEGYTYSVAGENLAAVRDGARGTLNAWMNSETHRDNILGNYTEYGLCVRQGMFMGTVQNVVVNHFGVPR